MSSTAEAGKGHAERRVAERRVADRRFEVTNKRMQIADRRDDTADLRDETADRREDAADVREDAADLRQDAADVRQDAADVRQDAADLRQEAADLREELADLQEVVVKAKAELGILHATQMREANEQLVVAAVNAQTKADEANENAVKMSYLAEHDSLTGLPNRSLLIERLAQSIAMGQRKGKKFALLYLDLDHFKHVNDTRGHAAGDQLLQSTAKRLLACVRNSDTVSRNGGDEFAVLLPDVDSEHDATLTARKLLRAMAEPHLIDGHLIPVTLSIGISLYPGDGNDIKTMMMSADTAMYHAKRGGRNQLRCFSADMNSRHGGPPAA